LPPGAKIISVEKPASAYDEVIINDGEWVHQVCIATELTLSKMLILISNPAPTLNPTFPFTI
jgi:hypothetical protein